MSPRDLVSILCGTSQFKKREKILEASLNQLIPETLTLDAATFKPVCDLHNTLKVQRDFDEKTVDESLLPLVRTFKGLKDENILNDNARNLDVSQLQKRILFFDEQLSQLEENFISSLKLLGSESSKFEDEIAEFQRDIEPQNNPDTIKFITSSAHVLPASLSNPEVEEFRKMLDCWGGHTGGWTVEDHSVFLQLRRKHNPNSVLYYLRQEMPDISAEEIARHESWYQQYCSLKMAQQKAITEWRERSSLSKQVGNSLSTVAFSAPNSPPRRKSKDIKEKIIAWKTLKKAERDKEKEANLFLKEKQKADEEMKSMKQAKLKEKVKLYKTRKEMEAQAAVLQDQEQARYRAKKNAETANSMIKQYRKEDLKWLERKRMKQLHFILKEEQRLEQEKALATFAAREIKVFRDPQRIYKPTKVWERKLDKSNCDEETNSQVAVHLGQIRHLGIPEWRMGL